MEFRRGDEIIKIYTEPNSLYIMSGDSRYTHMMRGRKSDPKHGKRSTRNILSEKYQNFGGKCPR